jgi:hypothetical protein
MVLGLSLLLVACGGLGGGGGSLVASGTPAAGGIAGSPSLNPPPAGGTPGSPSVSAAAPTADRGTPHTALPTATLPAPWRTQPTPTPRCAAVNSIIASNPVLYPGLAGQAWAAEQLVVGVVVEQRARWEIPADEPLIVTYSRLRVEERVRGEPERELTIKQLGGLLDGCTQVIGGGAPALRLGERVLLFLRRSGSIEGGASLYYIAGGGPGLSWVTPDGRTVTNANGLDPRPLETVLASARQALGQPPPRELSRRHPTPPSPDTSGGSSGRTRR